MAVMIAAAGTAMPRPCLSCLRRSLFAAQVRRDLALTRPATLLCARRDTMIKPAFIAADPASWISHGRSPEVAQALARVWRKWPDLPAAASKEARRERFRQRVAAMRPINEALARESDRRQQASNFAFSRPRPRTGMQRS